MDIANPALKEKTSNNSNTDFVALTPTDCADEDGKYSSAIKYALDNDQIKNIAITGPYGSGKSSIIKTFEKNHNRYKFLNISLATFKDDNESYSKLDDKESDYSKEEQNNRLIERSILQQMLYGADADKLPYSRFRRISKPIQPYRKAFLLLLWVLFGLVLFDKTEFLSKLNVELNFSSQFVIIALMFFMLTVIFVAEIIKLAFRTPIKKLSLTKGEFESADLPDGSILNKHLDEIIYFFKETDYNVVVIEDLDRFGSPEIFIKLREINKILNDNGKGKKVIKFLYALKDDMFVHKDRAKFFDFIIPIVPVINSSNSLDKILERIKGQPYASKIDMQFLREVSFLLDDMRLINNIFNEFNIYYAMLKSNSLDLTKLLSMMIYKNSYPTDFEQLHHGKGALVELCSMRVKFLKIEKEKLQKSLFEIKNLLNKADGEDLRSIKELMSIYIGYIVAATDKPVCGIYLKNYFYFFKNLYNENFFDELKVEQNIQLSSNPNNPSYRLPLGKSFQQIEREVNPDITFDERKNAIENKSKTKRMQLIHEITNTEREITALPFKKLKDLITDEEISFEEVLKSNTLGDNRLFLYLVKNGYLDDNHSLYTSNFYEGRMTASDRDFIIAIGNNESLPPEYSIDTPKEVCANMREEYFGYKYVMNVKLVDYLLSSADSNLPRIKMAMRYISGNFEVSKPFLSAYFISGKHLELFVKGLSFEWPSLIEAVLQSSLADEMISYILRFVEQKHIEQNMNTDSVLTRYLNEFGFRVFASGLIPPKNYEIIKNIGVEFLKLSELETNTDVVEYAYKNNLYSITTENVIFLMNHFSANMQYGTIDCETSNLTAILASRETYLKNYVDVNILPYTEKVFLLLSKNVKETEDTILWLLKKEELNQEIKEKIILKQEHVFNNIKKVPTELWVFLLKNDKVTISWQNLSAYYKTPSADKKQLTQYIQEKYADLSECEINTSLPEHESILKFILDDNSLSNEAYRMLVQKIPYKYKSFCGVSIEKEVILVQTGIVILSDETFEHSVINDDLRTVLVENNYSDYSEDKSKYPITDNIRANLLNSIILKEEQKLEICCDISPEGITEIPSLATTVSKIIAQEDIDCTQFNKQILQATIIKTNNITDAIKILLKCMTNWDKEMITDTLSKLKEPYSDIVYYAKRIPKLPKNDLNLQLVRNLKSKGLISSYEEEKNEILIITFAPTEYLEESNS